MELVKENGTSLAWIGDAYMSLEVRKHLLALGYQNPNKLQKRSIGYLSATNQAKFLKHLLALSFFTEEERTILNRGRNATIHSSAKNASIETYRMATSLEAIVGYWVLYHHAERLTAFFNQLWIEEKNK